MDLTKEEKVLIIKMCYQKISWYESEIDKIENMPPSEESYFSNKKYNLISSKNKLLKIAKNWRVKNGRNIFNSKWSYYYFWNM